MTKYFALGLSVLLSVALGSCTDSADDPSRAPIVTALSPTSGPAGATVAISGSDLSGAAVVSFNGTAAATFTVVSATSITATVPTGATTGPLTVTTPGGTSNGLTFTVLAPSITVVAPAVGWIDDTVTVHGFGLADATSVLFNGVPTPVLRATATTLTVVVPARATTGAVTAQTATGARIGGGTFTVRAPTTAELLLGHDWVWVSGTTDRPIPTGNGADSTTDYFSLLSICQTDNILRFTTLDSTGAAGTGLLDEGAQRCVVSTPQTLPATWQLRGQAELTFGTASTLYFYNTPLVSITRTEMVLRNRMVLGGFGTVMVTYTYRAR